MAQPYDRFAGQNLVMALTEVRAERLKPPAGYIDTTGAPVPVNQEADWVVVASVPGGWWTVSPSNVVSPKGKSKPWALIAFGFVVVVLFGYFASKNSTKSSTPAMTSSPASTSSQAAPAAPVTVIPSPDASQKVALLTALGAIDPGLDNDRSINRARNACSDIQGGVAHDKIVSNVHARFEGGSVPSLTDAQAEQIISAISNTFCN